MRVSPVHLPSLDMLCPLHSLRPSLLAPLLCKDFDPPFISVRKKPEKHTCFNNGKRGQVATCLSQGDFPIYLERTSFAIEAMPELSAYYHPSSALGIARKGSIESHAFMVPISALALADTAEEVIRISLIISLFPSVGRCEREVWDMIGVSSINHPDLRGISTVYGFEGHPLRKNLPLSGYVDVRYDDPEKRVVFEAIEMTQEFRYFDSASPWE
nr:NADH dehydrogenase subunit 9, mitochondrial [Tanacetum cinerariifolium]